MFQYKIGKKFEKLPKKHDSIEFCIKKKLKFHNCKLKLSEQKRYRI